ncbi:efflux RND transporter periplasmic adaptor subunit [Desulfomicrobium baculatum]|nr:efflux RND transporter periplasmic adaptor subunit [Desulfomicrobium baculatum]
MNGNSRSLGFFFPGAAVVVVCLTLLASCEGQKEVQEASAEPRPVKMMTVGQASQATQRSFPGTVRAARRAELAFQVSGTLIRLPVGEGQEVREGDVLAQLEQRDFETGLRSAQGQYGNVRAALESAKSEYERILRIRKQDPGATSESMIVKRREAMDRATAELESVQAAVDAARDKLGYTRLHAPFSGIVSRRHVENFQEVQAKEPVVSLDDISSLEILVDLPESVVARINEPSERTGKQAPVHAEFAALPGREFSLIVKEFSTRADPKTQTFQVVFQMEKPDDVAILPGMTAMIVGSAQQGVNGDGRYVIPAVAVFGDEQGVSHVWVVEPKSMAVQRRKVGIGEVAGDAGIRITEGLQAGEIVAVSGASQLRDGMRVKPFDGTF